jgi:hypothetical protein
MNRSALQHPISINLFVHIAKSIKQKTFMDQFLLHVHSVLRWGVLILLLLAILKSIGGGNKPFTNGHVKAGLFLMITCDIMLLIGIYQWLTGKFGLYLFRNFSIAEIMKTKGYRFFAIEHIFLMLLAIIFVHIGKSYAKKNIPDAKKHRNTVMFYVMALILILAAIPWPFMAAGQGRGWY